MPKMFNRALLCNVISAYPFLWNIEYEKGKECWHALLASLISLNKRIAAFDSCNCSQAFYLSYWYNVERVSNYVHFIFIPVSWPVNIINKCIHLGKNKKMYLHVITFLLFLLFLYILLISDSLFWPWTLIFCVYRTG